MQKLNIFLAEFVCIEYLKSEFHPFNANAKKISKLSSISDVEKAAQKKMMLRVIVTVAIVGLMVFDEASSAFLSDGVAKFNFTKLHDGSDGYDFE